MSGFSDDDGEVVAVPAAVSVAADVNADASAGIGTGGEAWRDGAAWRIGGHDEVRWIDDHTGPGRSITSAIPAVFDEYATLLVPDGEQRTPSHDALLALLRAHSPDQPWWLGYLETGASDIVFPEAPRVRLYSGWNYVLVQAGPEQAAGWRRDEDALPWHGALPELIFPLDHSWLVSTLWDDDWRCLGGPDTLVDALVADPRIEAQVVSVDEDSSPPGHVAG